MASSWIQAVIDAVPQLDASFFTPIQPQSGGLKHEVKQDDATKVIVFTKLGLTGVRGGQGIQYRASIGPAPGSNGSSGTEELSIYIYPFTSDPKRNCRAVMGGLEILKSNRTLFTTTQDASKY